MGSIPAHKAPSPKRWQHWATIKPVALWFETKIKPAKGFLLLSGILVLPSNVLFISEVFIALIMIYHRKNWLDTCVLQRFNWQQHGHKNCTLWYYFISWYRQGNAAIYLLAEKRGNIIQLATAYFSGSFSLFSKIIPAEDCTLAN